jgi:predicted TIM-barrel fold metal-dependent hydrolase
MERMTEANQERLEAEGGACIMYTHFGRGFHEDGHLHRRFRSLMERLAGRPGWFVPVTTLLDYIQSQRGPATLRPSERRALERHWLAHKILYGMA